MTKKKIVLEDGRYLIYYTFDQKQCFGSKSNPKHQAAKKCCGGAK